MLAPPRLRPTLARMSGARPITAIRTAITRVSRGVHLAGFRAGEKHLLGPLDQHVEQAGAGHGPSVSMRVRIVELGAVLIGFSQPALHGKDQVLVRSGDLGVDEFPADVLVARLFQLFLAAEVVDDEARTDACFTGDRADARVGVTVPAEQADGSCPDAGRCFCQSGLRACLNACSAG